jgi:glutaminyl-tRNA synthetase
MNFSLAFSKLDVPMESRRTVFRYDDTNPEAESKEYIDSLKRDLEWLGWKPEKTTFSSDNFDFLESCAERLIKAGKAYVCFLNSVEVEAQRECCKKRIGAVSKGLDPDKEVRI